ncbi:MAG: ACT domain-containing protein, partial [Actinomycetota bacterium]
MHRHVLTLACDDRPGLIHAVTGGLLDAGGNIGENHQFTDPDTSTFCMRTVVATPTDDPTVVEEAVAAKLDALASGGERHLRVRPESRRPRVMIMVSRYDHCLVDLLYRWRNG